MQKACRRSVGRVLQMQCSGQEWNNTVAKRLHLDTRSLMTSVREQRRFPRGTRENRDSATAGRLVLSGDLESAAQALKRGWGAAARKIEQGSDNTVKQQAKQKELEQFTTDSTSPKYTYQDTARKEHSVHRKGTRIWRTIMLTSTSISLSRNDTPGQGQSESENSCSESVFTHITITGNAEGTPRAMRIKGKVYRGFQGRHTSQAKQVQNVSGAQ